MSDQDKYIPCKLMLIGEKGVGKEKISKCLGFESFKQKHSMTLGVDFTSKRHKSPNCREIYFQFFILRSESRFKSVREALYSGAIGAILVFDVDKPETYVAIPRWIEELVENIKSEGENKIVLMILIGNKVNFDKEGSSEITKEKVSQYVKELSQWASFQIPYIELNLKTSEGIEELNEYMESLCVFLDLRQGLIKDGKSQIMTTNDIYAIVKKKGIDEPGLADMIDYLKSIDS